MSHPHTRRRYPGAVPFETEQQDIFFGRGAATEELYGKITLERLVVLYGKSGDGKSSLLNAGIIPRALREAERLRALGLHAGEAPRFEPVKIRFEACRKGETTQTPVEKAFAQIAPMAENDMPAGDVSLWRALQLRQQPAFAKATAGEEDKPASAKATADEAGTTTLLIFDQFEELFTYPPEQYEQFGRQLAEALNVRLPMRYAHTEASSSAVALAKAGAQYQPLRVHVLIGIRSDRLQLLNLLQRHLPNIQKNNYALPPLNAEEAEDAVLFPALKTGDFDTPSFDFDDAALHRITAFLTKNGSQPVASFQLQILCESLEKKVLAAPGLRRIGPDDVGDPEALYENYYRDRIAELDAQDRIAARRLIEDGLIYEEEDRRLSLYEGQIHRDFGVQGPLLDRLVDVRLLRAEPSLQGGYTYELSHDTLVRPVARMKAARKDAERRARERKQRLRLAGTTALAVLGFGLAGFSYWQYLDAEKARNQAVWLREEAERVNLSLKKTVEELEAAIRQREKVETDELLRVAESAVAAGRVDIALRRLQEAVDAGNIDYRLRAKIEQLKRQNQ